MSWSTSVAPTRRRLAGSGAVLVAGLGVVLCALLDAQVPDAHREALDLTAGLSDALTALALSVAGATVLARSRHPLGWLMAGFGTWCAVDSVAGSWLAFSTYQDPMLPGASSAFWVYQRLGAGLVLLLPLVLLLYPDGRFPTGRWRWAGIVGLTCAALLPLAIVLAPSDAAQRAWDAAAMPTAFGRLELDPMSLPLPHDVWLVVLRAAYVLVSLSLILPFAVVVHRYRHATGLRRTQMRWLVWAALMDLLVMLSLRLLPGDVSSLGFTICVAVTAGAVAVGLTRPDVIDVDRLLSSTIVYGALVVISYLLDLLVLGASAHFLGTHVTGSQALVVSVFVVSVVYAPLRHRLWRLVRRGARGERDDPYAVVSGLAERLETTDAPEDQLLEVAGAVARAFRTSYVGVEVQQSTGGRLLVEHGPRPGAVDRMPIAYRGETIGQLLLPPGPRERLRPSDERLLADVVRQGAAAARAAQLADDLQGSRERMVTAVEDERRRLRNELHDGLGPTLAAIASRIDLARIAATADPTQVDRLLGVARDELTDVLAEVRRLVHGLRPPALDDVGLAGAIRQQVDRLRAPDLAVSTEIPDRLNGLPAAVEVAAYRIVSEALTNVVRHSGATVATVKLSVAKDGLRVEVGDNGIGIDPSATAGVGLISLRERADELGGRSEVTARPGGGTVVVAVLPLMSGVSGDAVRTATTSVPEAGGVRR